MKRETIGDLSRGRNNTFDFLRFLLATMVIFSHSFALLYNHTAESFDPLLRATGGQAAFGGLAVDGFFLISGFLITMSWEHCKTTLDFAQRRILRIVPALLVILGATVFIIGPLATTLPLHSYFSSAKTYMYFTMMGTLNLHLTDRLPGVFTANPLAWRVNGSLWTIRCELLCYILVAILGLTRGLRRPLLVLLASITGIGVFALHGHRAITTGEFADSLRVLTYFLWGITFYLYRDRIPHSLPLLIVALAGMVISEMTGILSFTLPILGAYTLFYAALRPVFGLQRFARHGDFSYGLYLYAFPIEQTLVSRFPHAWNVATVFFSTFSLALICAVLSWHLVEKQFLQLKRKAEKPVALPEPPAIPLVFNGIKHGGRVGEKL